MTAPSNEDRIKSEMTARRRLERRWFAIIVLLGLVGALLNEAEVGPSWLTW